MHTQKFLSYWQTNIVTYIKYICSCHKYSLLFKFITFTVYTGEYVTGTGLGHISIIEKQTCKLQNIIQKMYMTPNYFKYKFTV